MSRKITDFMVVTLVVLNLVFLVACGSESGVPVTTSDTEPDKGPNLSADEICDKSHRGDSEGIQPIIYSSSSVQNSSSSAQFIPNINYGSITDSRDGKTYKTVVVGSQTWMAENLDYQDSRFINNMSLAGTLYTWAEAVDSAGFFSSSALECKSYGYRGMALCTMPDRVRGICPEGWHIPSSAEWREMLSFVSGGKYDGKSARVSDEIFKVLRSTSGWDVCPSRGDCEMVDGVPKIRDYISSLVNRNGTDLYGFSIRPTTYVLGGVANRYMTIFWIPDNFTIDDETEVGREYLSVVIKGPDDTSGMYEGAVFTVHSLYSVYDYSTTKSVRCIKDLSSSSSSVVPPQSSSSSTSVPTGTLTDPRDVFSSSSQILIASSSSVYDGPKQSIKVSACGSYCSCGDDECVKCVKNRTTVCPSGMSRDLRRSIIQKPCDCW